jgi:hypothetical protein
VSLFVLVLVVQLLHGIVLEVIPLLHLQKPTCCGNCGKAKQKIGKNHPLCNVLEAGKVLPSSPTQNTSLNSLLLSVWAYQR